MISIQVEGLLEDVDFKLKVTREEFEELCSDLFTRVGEPVKRALLAADMTLVSVTRLSNVTSLTPNRPLWL